jgi:hypothetical protein
MQKQKRENITCLPGLTSGQLSKIVNCLPLSKPDARGRMHRQPMKKAILRAIFDRYPNVWPGIDDVAGKVGCCVRYAEEMLRELEFEDRFIVDITRGVGRRISWVVPGAGPTLTTAKVGGTGKTVQYFICDRKIVDLFVQWALYTPDGEPDGPKPEDKKAARRLMDRIDKAYGNPALVEPEPRTGSTQNPALVESEPRTSRAQNPALVEPEPRTWCGGSSNLKEEILEEEKEESKKTNLPTSNLKGRDVAQNERDGGQGGWDDLSLSNTSQPREETTLKPEQGLRAWMRTSYSDHRSTGEFMMKSGEREWNAVETLAEKFGERVVQIKWVVFIKKRNLEGLDRPLTAFVKEFDTALDGDPYMERLVRVERMVKEGKTGFLSRQPRPPDGVSAYDTYVDLVSSIGLDPSPLV